MTLTSPALISLVTMVIVGLVGCNFLSASYQTYYGINVNAADTERFTDISDERQCALCCLGSETCRGFLYRPWNKECFLHNGMCITRQGGYTIYSKDALNLTEDQNLARGKPANQSSTILDGFEASLGVDGEYHRDITYGEDYIPNVMFHTDSEANPWWRVDLVETHCVWAVYFLNRANHDLWVNTFNIMITVAAAEDDVVYDADIEYNQCGYIEGTAEQYDNHVTCTQPITGRFVQLQKLAVGCLHLYEVEVHGQ